jgi:hypothetical protein
MSYSLTVQARNNPTLCWSTDFTNPGLAYKEGSSESDYWHQIRTTCVVKTILNAIHNPNTSYTDISHTQKGRLLCLAVPLRLNNRKDFSKDLFRPAIQQALKVQEPIRRIFTLIAAFFIDLATLPIRLITALPWAIFLSTRQENSFHKVMRTFFRGVWEANQKTPIDPSLLKEDGVKVTLISSSEPQPIQRTIFFTAQ